LIFSSCGSSDERKSLQEDLPGRWLTFDIGDVDGDGYKDIVFGASGRFKNHQERSGSTAGRKLFTVSEKY
jgi:hypothetical protein